jgi:hypothetical protein
MIEINTDNIYDATMIDAYLRPQITGFIGLRVDGGAGQTTILLPDNTPQADQDKCTEMLSKYNAGVVSHDAIVDNDGIYTCTISGTLDVSDASAQIKIWDSKGELDFASSVIVVGGAYTYDFESAIPDTYTVAVYGIISNMSACMTMEVV